MTYEYNEKVSARALADLRESVGWNRLETGARIWRRISILQFMKTRKWLDT